MLILVNDVTTYLLGQAKKNFFLNLRLIQDDCSEVGSTDEEILTPAL